MSRFTYQAQSNDGQTVTGTMQASDRNAALQTLSETYSLVTELRELKSKRSLLGFLHRQPSTEQMLGFFQQLAVATGAGVPLKSVLDTMSEDSDHPILQKAIVQLSEDLSGGATLSQAMLQHPRLFAAYQSRMVMAGEASGKMSEILEQLASDLEGSEALGGQIRSAVAYPLFVLGVAFLLSAAMLAWGVPQIKSVFDGMNAQLPLPTQILVFIGLSLSTYWPLWLGGLALTIYGVPRVLAIPRVRLRLENLLLGSWPFGEVYRLYTVSMFARTLGLLYRSGLPLSQALEILTETAGTGRMSEVVATLKTRVTHGETLASAMRGTGFFPSMAVEMVATGENSGSLERMLNQLQRFYTRRCETAIKSATTLIEPALTVVVGILLAGVILGLALPFLNLPSLMM